MPASSNNRDAATQSAHCRLQLKGGSRSFHAAAFLLPSKVREPASALYAFCRMADDLIDGPGDADFALEELHERIDCIYRGQPRQYLCDQAMARVVSSHVLPKSLLHALLDGFSWDAQQHEYVTLSDILAYSARVAGSVGVMMALLMGVRERSMLARAADLGVAMQLTNIARDVGEDAGLGRVYLPTEWLQDAGISRSDFVAKPEFSAALGKVTRRMLGVADELYRRADSGIAKLPASCRPAMYAARLLYAGIGRVVADNGYDSVSSRAVVPGQRKLRILLQLPRMYALPTNSSGEPALTETGYLVEHACSAAAAHRPVDSASVPAYERRVSWVLDLFDELHRRETQTAELAPAGKRNGLS